MRWLNAWWGSMERHPWLWTLAALAPLVLFPQIDLSVAAWFYAPEQYVFPARSAPFPEWIRKSMPVVLFAVAGAVAILWLAGEAMRRVFLGVSRRVAAFLLLSLALGPGLVVNLILKDNWGRPRPSTLMEFGGKATYVRPLMISDQCDDNCSFTSGHGALGFWPLAFALLAPPAWRPLAVAASLIFGAVVGLVRIAQGGHFVSDVAFSAAITIGLILWLYRRLLGESSKNHRQ
ncbi:putative undecaprenyl pyrophosphate phosphatase [Magnetospirillum sp. LM-5]|uniref:phosphatase PAP2 family protein n=1 Tax=Magnetospirillum sp. LM-5 TaxID=2681466 RepID=UPI0013863B00|nr:phosphatase PAP2 family protein [Magnetospirillum sp. LM-5]CAA7616563.1 putative undecaprenyl pyrophosphate phosphatase [Magnetospirillum sp. LM-5]